MLMDWKSQNSENVKFPSNYSVGLMQFLPNSSKDFYGIKVAFVKYIRKAQALEDP